MHELLIKEALTTDDVLLVPRIGKLNSRKDAKMGLMPYIYSAPMDSVTGFDMYRILPEYKQAPVLSRFSDTTLALAVIIDKPDNFIAAGIDTYKNVAKYIQDVGQTINIALDVAHGTTPAAREAYNYLSEQDCVEAIMSGSVCTPEQARTAYESGCTHIRIGIGPGSACTTRIATGCGFPQLSAVHRIHNGFSPSERNMVTLIADGGIRNSGDIVKYLAAGADAVMLGSMLANAKESAGWKYEENENGEQVKYKYYRGQASADFHKDVLKREESYIEGVTTRKILYKDAKPVKEILTSIDSGIRSAISYLGLTSIDELNPSNTQFIKITQNGMRESDARSI